jgi:NAD(P)-dependent dehydrogenase (short-subunit alcohol dehydrogenase family)
MGPRPTGRVTLSHPEDIAAAVLFLASDDARTVTGIQLPIDHGASKV